MADDPAGQDSPKTFTQEELDAAITERNKALEKKRDELLSEAKAAKDATRQREEELAKLQTKIAEMEQEQEAKKVGITSEQLDKMRAEAQANLEKQYGPLKQQLEDAQREVRELRLDNVVKGAMSKAGVRAERIDALYRLTSDRYDLTDDGKPMLKDDPGTPIDTHIKDEVSKEFPEFFEGTGSSGGGAPKSVSSGIGRVKKIAADDGSAFMSNLEAIAKGEVEVVP